MKIELACAAIDQKQCLELRYDGYNRIVEVHAVGTSTDGNAIMRVWQVRGGSGSGERQGWKLLLVGEVRNAAIINEASEAPRRGYKRGDKAMTRIYRQV